MNDNTSWHQEKRYWILGIILFLIIISLGDEESSGIQSAESTQIQRLSTETGVVPAVESIEVRKVEAAPVKQNCHPSYSGCLRPNASDYDCAGGSGNGPYYTGPVQVIGPDVFGLDRDGDGWGCE